MKICSKCQTENIFDEAQFCKNCGTPLEPGDTVKSSDDITTDSDDPDFVINETKEPDSPGLMQSSGGSQKEKDSEESVEEFEITSTADILDLGVEDDEINPIENEPAHPGAERNPMENGDLGISWDDDKDDSRQSASEVIPSAEEKISPTQKEPESVAQSSNAPDKAYVGIPWEENPGKDEKSSSNTIPSPEAETSHSQKESESIAQSSQPPEKVDKEASWGKDTGQVKEPPTGETPCTENEILAAQYELKSIAQSSDVSDAQPNQTERADLVTPIDDPANQADQTPLKAQKARGVAYFRKNNIRVAGNPFFHDGDEIIISQKSYVLHPWKLGHKYKIGMFSAGIFIVLILLASFFIGSTTPGEGTIIGIILDQNNRPYLEGAVVSIPSLGKKTRTNAQGFFKFELIPAGTYELEYELGDRLVGQGNITVTGGQETLMSFGDISPRTYAQKKSSRQKEIKKEPPERTTSQTSDQTSSISDKKQNIAPGKGKIKLEANVESARLVLEGQILGAGNMVYSQINAGRRQITIEKAGYEDYHATIDIKPNETTVVNANLKPLKKQLNSSDYLSLGKDAFNQKQYADAIDKFNKAIKLSPGMAEAYELRAAAYKSSGKNESASNDFIKAGEIYRIGNKPSKSIKAFSSALDLFPENTTALIGRAGARLDNSDYGLALQDYESILNIDENSYQALYGSGVCHFRLSDYKKAEKQFEKAYKIDHSDPILYHYLMLTFLARDKIKDVRRAYAEFKTVASPGELAQFKSSSRFEPILRLIEEENR